MALQITFKAGERQAVDAGRYFQEEANAVVNAILDASTPRNYYIAPGNAPSIPLRFWSSAPLTDAELTALAHLADEIVEDVRDVVNAAQDIPALSHAYVKWSAITWPTGTFFLERLGPHHPFGPKEEVRSSIAVVDRTLVLVSAERFIQCRLAPGFFGMAIAGKGSFLMEQVDAAHAVHTPTAHLH